MKKIFGTLAFLIIISSIVFAQSSSDRKHINKLELKVVSRGIDFDKTFIVEDNYQWTITKNESVWSRALFNAGLTVGEAEGDYLFELNAEGALITDRNNNKLVATLTFNRHAIQSFGVAEYVIQELIKENKKKKQYKLY